MLENINSPKDILSLNKTELKCLAGEIRKTIISTVTQNGGHLASNLGLVEASIAIHRVFNAPEDSIVFDVGHQCYAHKLLTGRYSSFNTLRKFGGISGFTNPEESEYDTTVAGHSGASVSAALGIASANRLLGNDFWSVAVVGDGSFTNGMIYEAINNIAQDVNRKLIIILNDNEMSISKNVGGLSEHLSRIRVSKRYFSLKHRTERALRKIPAAGDRLVVSVKKIKDAVKRMLMNQNFFEAMKIDYYGPVDGNDICSLETVLREAKSFGKCCIIHMTTVKGLGYEPAEKNPSSYHSVGPSFGKAPENNNTFTSHIGNILTNAAEKDNKIVAITSSMCDGTGLCGFRDKFPERFFDVGISEEHEITFAGGLALKGLKPVCAVYSTFSQRMYDQVFHDIALQKLPLTILLDRAGIVPGDGMTHQGLYDTALFRSIPGVEIFSPETYTELEELFYRAVNSRHISILRYPKGSERSYDRKDFTAGEDLDTYNTDGAETVIITYGRITYTAVKAAELLKGRNIKAGIIKLKKLFPLDQDILKKAVGKAEFVYILEEGVRYGGIGEYIASVLPEKRTLIHAAERILPHGNINELEALCGFTPDTVADRIEAAAKSTYEAYDVPVKR